MKVYLKQPKILALVAGLLALLGIIVIATPAIGKWRDKVYFSKYQQTFNDLVALADNSDCDGRCIESLPDSIHLRPEPNNWLLCYGNDQLVFLSLTTPSENHYVYAAGLDNLSDIYSCGYNFIGSERINAHWYLVKVVVYN